MRVLLTITTIIFIIFQVSLTVQNKHAWPFCAYTMFNKTAKKIMIRPKLKIFHNDGSTKLIDLHETVPFEFFKAIGIYFTIFETLPLLQKEKYADFLINTINTKSWNSFDEVYSLYNPENNLKVTGFDFQIYKLDMSTFKKTKKITTNPGRVIYSKRDKQ